MGLKVILKMKYFQDVFIDETTHSRLNIGECSSEESALPTGSILSILLSFLLCASSASS